MQRILRLEADDELIIFSRSHHAQVRIVALDKKSITVHVITSQPNHVLKPTISFLLPILKREAFEAALYFLVEAGVNDIYPVVTAKAHRTWGGQRERDRLDRIMISAAEQSKHFSLGTLHEPLSLVDAVRHTSEANIFFDAVGQPLSQVVSMISKAESVTLLIGPEGDLTPDEKSVIDKAGFVCSRLTPTILRAEDAAGVGACMIRSLLF
jgi:16S rRNA (uracil1498-N3)-methyltransferase